MKHNSNLHWETNPREQERGCFVLAGSSPTAGRVLFFTGPQAETRTRRRTIFWVQSLSFPETGSPSARNLFTCMFGRILGEVDWEWGWWFQEGRFPVRVCLEEGFCDLKKRGREEKENWPAGFPGGMLPFWTLAEALDSASGFHLRN